MKEGEKCYNLNWCRKSIWLNHTCFHSKNTKKPGTEGNWPNLIKSIYEKATANITLNSEGLKVLPQRSGTRQECLLSPLTFNIVLEVLATAIRQEKEIKGIHIWKENYLYSQRTWSYIKKILKNHKRILELIDGFGKVTGCMINIQ